MINQLIFVGMPLGILFSTHALPVANAADITLNIVVNGDSAPDEVSIWEESSSTPLDPKSPIIYTLAWTQNDPVKELDVTAKWKDAGQDIGLKLYKQYAGRKFEIPINRPDLAGLEEKKLASRCANNSSVRYAVLLDDYYLCRQLFRRAKEHSNVKLSAARGWFDTAYRLSILAHTPIRWDSEIANIMQRYEDRAAWDTAFADRLREVVPTGYVKQVSRQAAIADLRFVNDVGPLINAGALEDAQALNRHLWNLFSNLSRESGEKVINGVTEKTFAENDALIRTKLENRQKRVSALQ
jgi:hypothetical protein